jgi:hypothetical protein
VCSYDLEYCWEVTNLLKYDDEYYDELDIKIFGTIESQRII